MSAGSISPIPLLAALVCALILPTPAARAAGSPAEPTPGLGFDYPELLVTPRASERLTLEATGEVERRWSLWWAFQASAGTTLIAGLLQDADTGRDPSNKSRMAGLAVGAAWLGGTVALALLHQPYAGTLRRVGELPKGNRREELVRERLAEEGIRSAGGLAKRLKWLSLVSNLGAGAYMAVQSKSGTLSQIVDGLAVVASLAPVIFEHPWERVARDQDEYKKRIYGPVAQVAPFVDPTSGGTRWVPGLALTWAY